VHLADWPTYDESLVNPRLRDETALVMQLVNLGRAAREQAQIRVRQPLATLYVTTQTDAERESLERLADQVLEELNVKRLELLPRESDMLTYTLKPRRSALGPKYGKRLPALLAAIAQADAHAAARELREGGGLTLTVEGGEPVTLTPDEVDVEAGAREGFVAAEERGYVVALDTTLTPDLLAEGLMRDLTHFVQDARKKAGLAIEDSISLWLATDAELAVTVERFAASIKEETLARSLTVSEGEEPDGAPADAYREAIPAAKLGGHAVTLALTKR
jgi:isoleucyl-tRNA synthetase